MKDKITYLEYNGIQYPMIFTLNVMEAIQEEYKTMDAWMDLIKENEPSIKALKFGLGAMINEGIDIKNETEADKLDFVNNKKIGRIITELGLSKVASKLGENVIASTKGDCAKNE